MTHRGPILILIALFLVAVPAVRAVGPNLPLIGTVSLGALCPGSAMSREPSPLNFLCRAGVLPAG
ncbi:hypothetical protein E2L08_05755 [Palleronia sediminis]|uniref:Uncharacterized protein n=1 Tax=Palleronia sediminis TaxID=2547833 RepID=A0A4R6AIV0_9RHOB|nr:hypothetical protein [Palleronia sediminis]TDL81616.1 hypothetical protein E2L08_05755 [Palleronia sediminis]